MNPATLQQLQQLMAAASSPGVSAPMPGGMPFPGGNIIYGLAPTFGVQQSPMVGSQAPPPLGFMLPGNQIVGGSSMPTGLRPPLLPGLIGSGVEGMAGDLAGRPPPLEVPRISAPTPPSEPRSAAPAQAAEKPKPCHLHKKPNKTCKFCRRFTEQQEALAAADQANQQNQQQHQPSSSSTSAPSDDKGRPVFQCSPILKDQILKASYFKSLMQITTVDALAEEIQNFCTYIDIYRPGSAVEPSEFLCCVFRLFTMEHTEEELGLLLDHPRSLCARCVGFLYLRFAERPERLWDALGDYVLDEMDFSPLQGKQPGPVPATVGEYVESILMKEKYYGTPLPRLPVAVRRKLEEKIAPLPQCRKRAQANRHQLKLFREKGVAVEFCEDGEWIEGQALDLLSRTPTRLKLNILVNGKEQVQAHLGRVILRDGSKGRTRSRSRSRSRGRSPDWSRYKGKSDATMVQELRESSRAEAVCASGKDYAKRPMGFEAGLAVRREQGSTETQMMQEDAVASMEGKKRRRATQEDDIDRDLARMRRTEEEQERQRKLMQIYEKYGSQGSSHSSGASSGGAGGDFDRPDVMRLG